MRWQLNSEATANARVRTFFGRCIAATVFAVMYSYAAYAAQGDLKLIEVQGEVLVTQASGWVAATGDQTIQVGTRVPTLTGGKATLFLSHRCEIRLEENQRVTISQGTDCAALKASIEQLLIPRKVTTAASARAAGEIALSRPHNQGDATDAFDARRLYDAIRMKKMTANVSPN